MRPFVASEASLPESPMHYVEFRAKVFAAFERWCAAPRSLTERGEPLDRLLAGLAINPAHLMQLLSELPTLVIRPVYAASLYEWAFHQLRTVATALGRPDLVIRALQPILDVGTLPRWTWFDLARELEAIESDNDEDP